MCHTYMNLKANVYSTEDPAKITSENKNNSKIRQQIYFNFRYQCKYILFIVGKDAGNKRNRKTYDNVH